MMEQINGVVTTFEQGGIVMWPILFFSIYATALIIERWMRYHSAEKEIFGALNAVLELSQYTDKDHERFAGEGMTGRLAQAVHSNRKIPFSDLVDKTRHIFADESAEMEKHLSAISVIASLLPMLGLLGTVVGMIISFNAIALHGTGDPKILANGISQALITTEAGLVTSIPIIYLHQILSARAERLIRKLDEYTTHLTHICAERRPE
jgi:biopolymer transport protein ExbB